MIRFILCAALSIVLLSGCLFREDPTEPVDIIPLAVGNTWIYVDSTYYGNDSTTVSTSEASIVGTRNIMVNGDSLTVFLNNSHAVGGAPSDFSGYVRNFGHSNYTLGAEQDSARVTGKVLHLEYPAVKGHRYPTYFYGFASVGGALVPVIDTVEIEVVDPHHTCTVPAGTFPCVEYRGYRTDGTLFATAYHAPGVGPLGNEQVRTEQVGTSTREIRIVKRLTSFTLHGILQ